MASAALALVVALALMTAPASAAVPTVSLTGITAGAAVTGTVSLGANA